MDDDSALVEAKRLPWNVDLQFSSLARREVDLECSSDHADAFRYSGNLLILSEWSGAMRRRIYGDEA